MIFITFSQRSSRKSLENGHILILFNIYVFFFKIVTLQTVSDSIYHHHLQMSPTNVMFVFCLHFLFTFAYGLFLKKRAAKFEFEKLGGYLKFFKKEFQLPSDKTRQGV